MLEHIWINPIDNSDLKVYQYGYEECEPDHLYGPATRDHYLLHFISSGKGTFYTENKSYTLSAGQGFLISPDLITSYKADSSDPWTYSWIGFNGTNAEYYMKHIGLGIDSPIFTYKNTDTFIEIFNDLKKLNRNTVIGQVRMTGCLYMLLAFLMECSTILSIQGKAFFSSKEEYVKNAVIYIQTNYSRKITVEEISDYIGLNRSYLGIIFKEYTNMTPQEFIIDFRINKAKKLLGDMSMLIGDVSRSVGYDDPLNFSKIFKKIVGVSPNAYRKNIKQS